MLTFDYRENDRRASISWNDTDESKQWLSVAKGMLMSASSEAVKEGAHSIALPWWRFLALRPNLLDLVRGFGMKAGVDFAISVRASELLVEAHQRADGYVLSLNKGYLTDIELESRLTLAHFSRSLKLYQRRNVKQLAALPAGATFSVPGAGKTTEALATFACRAKAGDRLLVVAPKNAFAAWDEQLDICLPAWGCKFTRLRHSDRIPSQLRDDPRFMLIGYQQLARVGNLISEHLLGRRVHVFLDESHRIKGRFNVSTEAILAFSHLPVSKLVMSGTPMPQSIADLVPQFQFLFPELDANENTVVDLIHPIYVRTTKSELELPPVTRILKSVQMDALQDRLYTLMRSEVARDATKALGQRNKAAFRTLGRSVIRLLRFVSNPALLANEIGFAHSTELAAALSEGQGPKLRYVIRRARQLAKEGKKVLIWSSFVANVEQLADSLQDLGAQYIHGGVDAGDEDDEETREGKIRLFHDDPNVMVLVANPAAASEGISLHTVCHHAIYLDRTFNAAHYLQSEDRIHRIGLAADQETIIEIVECERTVDETVRFRLTFKVAQMAAALEDPNLRIEPEPIEGDSEEEWDEAGLDQEDVRALLQSLTEPR